MHQVLAGIAHHLLGGLRSAEGHLHVSREGVTVDALGIHQVFHWSTLVNLVRSHVHPSKRARAAQLLREAARIVEDPDAAGTDV